MNTEIDAAKRRFMEKHNLFNTNGIVLSLSYGVNCQVGKMNIEKQKN